MPPGGVGADLPRSLRKALARVESGHRIEQALAAEPVQLELRAQKGPKLEEEGVTVERLAEELPGPRFERLDPLRERPDGPAVVMMIGVAGPTSWSSRRVRHTSNPCMSGICPSRMMMSG